MGPGHVEAAVLTVMSAVSTQELLQILHKYRSRSSSVGGR